MKSKIKHEKGNLIHMTSILILCYVTCFAWYYLHQYNYAIIFLIMTLVLTHTYYFTSYYIYDKYLTVRLGFIPIKFKLEKISSIKKEETKIKIQFNIMNMDIYPKELTKFYNMLNKKVGKTNG